MSRDYATVSPSFWTGATGRSLRKDPDAQIVALYLITSQHANMIGLYYCPIAYIVADTGLSEKGACKGLQRLSEALFCAYDPPSEWVWVREMARFQVGAKLSPRDNLVTHVRRELEKVPNLSIKKDFIEKYRVAFHLGFPEEPSPLQAPCKPLRSQEQEQEQEQEQDKEKDISTDVDIRPLADAIGPAPAAVVVLKSVKPPCPYEAIRDLYHEILPELRLCRALTDARKGYLKQRWLDKPGADTGKWRVYFEYVRESDFLMGRKAGHDGKPPFQADLEWLTRPTNFAKVIEGKYHQEVRHG